MYESLSDTEEVELKVKKVEEAKAKQESQKCCKMSDLEEDWKKVPQHEDEVSLGPEEEDEERILFPTPKGAELQNLSFWESCHNKLTINGLVNYHQRFNNPFNFQPQQRNTQQRSQKLNSQLKQQNM
ncbi:hypothetical protein niasHT_016422 [Heterodera trifolii]|uniref:Uncharacterized protein n=1 Tax=Heterodera trifolii TaxID=157864 RepID=A0ABD2LJE0_9BILA